MQICQGVANLTRPVQDLLLWYEALIAAGIEHDGAQILAGHIVHYQIVARPAGEEVGNFGEVGVIEARQNGSLPQKLLPGILSYILRKAAVILHLFESTEASFQSYIVGKINRACAALSDPFSDLIAGTQDFAGFQREGHNQPCQELSERGQAIAQLGARCRTRGVFP